MEFRLLGQFELWDGERGHHLGGPVQRMLLAHLLLAGRPVPADELNRASRGLGAMQTCSLLRPSA
ncbi:hypothetical protein [Lentzea californiensis]|uniref:hypothetical protein n=1 Tax=Lentzea californiensis TaxID=438851 RepID=UPI00216535A2|nr:hypothetical protein [Lentzea californiensis]MCR3754398.1 hypothetical protein [Lentzea californiensis]